MTHQPAFTDTPTAEQESLDGVLRDYLTLMRGIMRQAHPPRPDRRYTSYEELVLAQGRPYTPVPLPGYIKRGPQKQCYANTVDLVMAMRRRLKLDLTYVEGYAIPRIDGWQGIAVLHAWAVDETGQVLDPTWPEPEHSAYFGIPFAWSDVARFMVLTRSKGGLLPGDYLLGCPLIATGQVFPPGWVLPERYRRPGDAD